MKGTPESKTRREQIIQLREEGLTIREIKERLNLSSTSLVHHYLTQAKYEGVTRAKLIKRNAELEQQVEELQNTIKKLNKILKNGQ